MTCQRCGHCCKGKLIVQANVLDVVREPRIARRAQLVTRNGLVPDAPVDWIWVLVSGNPCPFLQADNTCEIYASRPNDCVAFLAGERRCVHANGLPERQLLIDAIVDRPIEEEKPCVT